MLATGSYDPPPSIIMVMGATGSGKSSFINLASGSELSVGTDLKSCTEEVQCSKEFTVGGRSVLLLDTPGFQDTFKSDMDILDSIAQPLAEIHEQRGVVGGIIYLHRISDMRFTGTAAKSFKTLSAMCGDQALQNVAIVTNMWGKVTQEGEDRERELSSSFFKPALDKGALFRRHSDTAESAHSIIGDILGKEQITLRIQQEIVDERKRVEETAAGRELLREFDDQVQKRLRQLRELQEMLSQVETNDGETRQELEQEVLKLEEELGAFHRMPHGPVDSFRSRMAEAVVLAFLVAGFILWKNIGGAPTMVGTNFACEVEWGCW